MGAIGRASAVWLGPDLGPLCRLRYRQCTQAHPNSPHSRDHLPSQQRKRKGRHLRFSHLHPSRLSSRPSSPQSQSRPSLSTSGCKSPSRSPALIMIDLPSRSLLFSFSFLFALLLRVNAYPIPFQHRSDLRSPSINPHLLLVGAGGRQFPHHDRAGPRNFNDLQPAYQGRGTFFQPGQGKSISCHLPETSSFSKFPNDLVTRHSSSALVSYTQIYLKPGACGSTASREDAIVALNKDQYGDVDTYSKNCFRSIHITNVENGRTANAIIQGEKYSFVPSSPLSMPLSETTNSLFRLLQLYLVLIACRQTLR